MSVVCPREMDTSALSLLALIFGVVELLGLEEVRFGSLADHEDLRQDPRGRYVQ